MNLLALAIDLTEPVFRVWRCLVGWPSVWMATQSLPESAFCSDILNYIYMCVCVCVCVRTHTHTTARMLTTTDTSYWLTCDTTNTAGCCGLQRELKSQYSASFLGTILTLNALISG